MIDLDGEGHIGGLSSASISGAVTLVGYWEVQRDLQRRSNERSLPIWHGQWQGTERGYRHLVHSDLVLDLDSKMYYLNRCLEKYFASLSHL